MSKDYEILTKQKYFKRAKWAAFILAATPFISMVGLNGSVARGESSEKSDIDFLIIAHSGRIFTCRAFSMVLMAIFGLKRYENKIAGRVCLNLYQTENHLDLSYKDHPGSPKYLAKNYSFTIALWQKNNIFTKFMAKNRWISEYNEHFHYALYKPSLQDFLLVIIMNITRKFCEIIFELFFNNWGESLLKGYQIKRIKNDPRSKTAKPGQVFISNKELRFHLEKN